ncbi:MAG: YncE family protein [Nitrospinaceae bacterium]
MVRYRSIFFLGLITAMISWGGLALAADSGASKDTPKAKKLKSSVNVEFFAQPNKIEGYSGAKIESGKPLRVGFRITDKETGYGISDLHPAGWIAQRPPLRGKPDRDSCERGIKNFLRGGLVKGAEGDLNNYYIISLNADDTIAIFNPLINLATSNLMALIPLKGKSGTWEFDESAGRVYVTQPEEGRVAVVDINIQALEGYIPVGKKPNQVKQQPDERYLWVGNEGSGTVSVIDRVSRKVVKTLEVGSGTLNIEFDSKKRLVFVGANGDGKLTVIDGADLKKKGEVTLGQGQLHLAFSTLSEALYVADEASGKLTVLYPETGKILTSLNLKPDVSRLVASPDGRFVFAVHKARNALTVIDTSSNRVNHRFTTHDQPDHLIFTPNFAYVWHEGNVHLSMIQLSALASPEAPPVADIPLGSKPPKEGPGLPGVLPMDITPDEGGLLIANAPDREIYFYKESGMLAASNSFKTYTSSPVGIFVYDHTLLEGTVVGEYSTSVHLKNGGIYDVYFLLNNPLVVHCFELEVEGPRNLAENRKRELLYDNLVEEKLLTPGKVSKIQFRLEDAQSREPIPKIKDLYVLGMKNGGGWNVRQWARHVGNGVYEVQFSFPSEGKYRLLIEARSMGVKFGRLGHTYTIASAGKPGKNDKSGGVQ